MPRSAEAREKQAAARRALYARSPEARAKQRAANLAYEAKRRQNAACPDLCPYCLSAPATVTDHVLAVNRGGAHVPENMVRCCRSCNLAKKERTPLEFLFGWPTLTM